MQVLFGERLPREEQHTIARAGVLGILFQRTGDDYGKLLSVIPWIRHFFPETSGYNNFKVANKGLYEFMKVINIVFFIIDNENMLFLSHRTLLINSSKRLTLTSNDISLTYILKK